MNEEIVKPSDETIRQAKSCPNGWIYEIEGSYQPDEVVPPESIRGAWKVDAEGNIEGNFVFNPNFQSKNLKK